MGRINYKTLNEGFEGLDNKGIYTYIGESGNEISITGYEFKEKVKRTLCYLQKKGISSGNELVFQIKSSLEFTLVFWACILGNIIPVPYTYLEADRDKVKLLKVWTVLKYPYLITDTKSLNKLKRSIANHDFGKAKEIEGRTVLLEDMLNDCEKAEIAYSEESDIAFIQFSSGSTSDPKGVVITHKNIISSINATLKAMQVQESDIYLSWLPLTHSFGLIGTYLTPLLAGCIFYIMPSNLFAANPLLWIEKLSEHKVTISASPNFGLKHVCKYLYLKKNMDLDLSSMRIIIDGAEPVAADVCREFSDKMSSFGLKETVVRPSYGLSEATLVVSTPKNSRSFLEICAIREQVKVGEKIIESSTKSNNTMSFVDVGECLDNFETRIVDDDYNTVGEQVVGTLLLKGDAVFSGYYNNVEATKAVLDSEGWFNTGDLGFMKEGKLVLTGRVKDVIFINGENYYSYDIERICENVKDENYNKVAICGIRQQDQEQIICFVELKGRSTQFRDIALKMKKQVVQMIGIGIKYFVPVDEIPVTVSGKIKRYLLMEQFDKGEFDGLLNIV